MISGLLSLSHAALPWRKPVSPNGLMPKQVQSGSESAGVEHHEGGVWKNRVQGNHRASNTFETKADAQARGGT